MALNDPDGVITPEDCYLICSIMGLPRHPAIKQVLLRYNENILIQPRVDDWLFIDYYKH